MINNENHSTPYKSVWPIVLAILIAGWMIGMSVVLAAFIFVKLQPQAPQRITQDNQSGPDTTIFDIPDNAPSLGDKNAPLRLIFYSDFQCPYCHEWYKTIFPKLKAEFIDTGKAYLVYQDFPFLGDESFDAAAAGECAHLQGRFVDFADVLFAKPPQENAGLYTRANLKAAAKQIGLNADQFNFCLDTNLTMNAVTESSRAGQNLNIQSTPTLVIGNKALPGVGSWDDLKPIIEAQIK